MAGSEIIAALLPDVKNHVNITWDDSATDKKVSELIASGTAYLEARCGKNLDFTVPGEARTLLMEYVRYGLGDALDVFENNYLHRLLALQNEGKVTAYVAQTQPT